MKTVLIFLKKHPIWSGLALLIIILAIVFAVSLSINNSFRKYTVEFFRGISLVLNGNKRCLVGVNRQFGNYRFIFGYLSYSKDSIILSSDREEESFNPSFIYFVDKNVCPVLGKSAAVGNDILKLYRFDLLQQTGWYDYYIRGKKFKYYIENIREVAEKNNQDKEFYYFKINDHIQIKMDLNTRKYVEVTDVFDQEIKGKYFVADKNIYVVDEKNTSEYNLGDCATCIFKDKYVKIFTGAEEVSSFYKDKYLAINNKLFKYSEDCQEETECKPEDRLKEIVLSNSNPPVKDSFQYQNIKLGNYTIKDGYLYYQIDTSKPLSIKDLILLSEGPVNFNVIDNGGDEGFRLISDNILKLAGVSEEGPIYFFGNYIDASTFYAILKRDGIFYDGGFEPRELKERNTSNLLHFLFTPNLEVVVNIEKGDIEDYSMYNYTKKYKNDLFLLNGTLYMKLDGVIPSEADRPINGFARLAQGVKDFSVNELDESLIEINKVIYKRQLTSCDKSGENCQSYSLVETGF